MAKTSAKQLAYILQWQRDNPEKVYATQKRWNNRQNAKGLCRDCKRPLAPGRKHCEVHLQIKRDERRQAAHGISAEAYEQMGRQQNYMCAICGLRLKLHIDHCHKSKSIRGLLCNNCNNGLGRFKDNPEWLIRAAQYLRSYETARKPDAPVTV